MNYGKRFSIDGKSEIEIDIVDSAQYIKNEEKLMCIFLEGKC